MVMTYYYYPVLFIANKIKINEIKKYQTPLFSTTKHLPATHIIRDNHPMIDTSPTLRFQAGSSVVPGDRIGTARQVLPGPGTYAKGGHVHASVLGYMELAAAAAPVDQSSTHDNLPNLIVSIRPKRSLASNQVLRVNQLVMGRVTRVSAPQATVQILATEGTGLLQQAPPPEGTIAREECVKAGSNNNNNNATSNMREVHECFQPGDMVLAKIISTGDARRYYLSTAESELGVLYAVCQASGNPMIPCNWKEMECPETGIKEPRKCAKPRQIAATNNNNKAVVVECAAGAI